MYLPDHNFIFFNIFRFLKIFFITVGSLTSTNAEKTSDLIVGLSLGHWYVFLCWQTFVLLLFTKKGTLSNHRILSLDHRWTTDINQRGKNVESYRWTIVGSLVCSPLLANLHTVPISQQSNHQILSLGHRWITDINRHRQKGQILSLGHRWITDIKGQILSLGQRRITGVDQRQRSHQSANVGPTE